LEHDNSDRAVLDVLKDLSAEATIQRRALEKLMERDDEYEAPVNYAQEIGGLSKHIAALTSQIAALENSPAFAKDGARILSIISNATNKGTGEINTKLRASIRDLDGIAHSISEGQKSERFWHMQNNELKRNFWGGIALGSLAIITVWMFWAYILGPTDADIAWLKTRGGRDAQAVAQLNNISWFLVCTGDGWRHVTDVEGHKYCVGDGKHGWVIP
jgi:hypothetical protein